MRQTRVVTKMAQAIIGSLDEVRKRERASAEKFLQTTKLDVLEEERKNGDIVFIFTTEDYNHGN